MKANIHPAYNRNAQVICVCGNRFTTGSTRDIIHVELCNKCHPFYTGEQRFVDKGNLIQRFQAQQSKAAQFQATNKKKVEEKKKKAQTPQSLREMLMGLK